MAELEQVDGNPFAAPEGMTPVEGNPFSAAAPEQPSVSQAFLNRVKQGAAVSRAIGTVMQGTLKAEGEALSEGGVPSINDFPDAKDFFVKHGFIRPDPSAPANGFVDGVRMWGDAAIRTTAAGMSAINRLFHAASVGGGTEVQSIAEQLGLVKPGSDSAKELGAQTTEMLDIAQVFVGGESFHTAHVGPMGEIQERQIGGLPVSSDFTIAAKAVTEDGPVADAKGKLKRAWDENGIHPAEAVADAHADPVVRQALVSKGPDMPYRAIEGPAEDHTGAPAGQPPALPPPPEPPASAPPAEPEPPKPGSYEEARDKILDHMSIGEKDPTTGRSLTPDRIYTNLVDRLYPIAKAVRESGMDLATKDDPYRLSRLFAGWAGKADVMLNHYTFDFATHEKNGASLKDVLEPVKDNLDDFRAFAASARAAELERRGIKTGFDMDAAQRVGANRTKLFEKTMLNLVDYQNRVAQYLRDSGVLSKAGHAEMLEANKLYVPFHVILQEKGLGISRVGETLQPSNPIKRIKGSELAKVDPLETIVKNTHLYLANAERNLVGTKLVDMLLGAAEKGGKEVALVPAEGTAISPLANSISTNVRMAEGKGGAYENLSDLSDFLEVASSEPKPGEVSIFRNGRRETWLVDPEIAEAFKNLNVQTAGTIEKMLRPLAKTLRAGAVLSPDFLIRHTIRDYVYAFTTYEGEGTFSPMDMARGLVGMITKDADFVKWMRDGGGQVGLVALDRNYLQKNLRELTEQTGLMTRSWNVVRHPLSVLQAANEVVTSASHLGAYKKAQGEGASAMDAAWISRATAVDVHRRGASTAAWNAIAAFTNVKIQDFDRIARALKDDPVNTTVKIAAGITIPSMLAWYLGKDDKRIQDRPHWERDAFWVLPAGDTLIRIPKPFSAGVIFGSSVERLMDDYVKHKPGAFDGFFASVLEQSAGDLLPNALVPIWEQNSNRSIMTGHNLVPAAMEGALPEVQYTPYTTETAKFLGRVIAAFPGLRQFTSGPHAGFWMEGLAGVGRAVTSPIQIENYVRAWTGTLGGYVLHTLDLALRKSGMLPDPPHAEGTLADIPVIRAFVSRYPGSSQSVQDFYDKASELKTWQTTLNYLRKQGDLESMERIRAAGGDDILVRLDSMKKAMNNQSAAIRNIDKLPEKEMSKGAKRQLIDSIYGKMVIQAQQGLSMLNQVESNLKAEEKSK